MENTIKDLTNKGRMLTLASLTAFGTIDPEGVKEVLEGIKPKKDDNYVIKDVVLDIASQYSEIGGKK